MLGRGGADQGLDVLRRLARRIADRAREGLAAVQGRLRSLDHLDLVDEGHFGGEQAVRDIDAVDEGGGVGRAEDVGLAANDRALEAAALVLLDVEARGDRGKVGDFADAATLHVLGVRRCDRQRRRPP